MKKSLLLMALLAAASIGTAQAAVKPCDELKSEIGAKLEKNGVKSAQLDIVDADKVGEAKVIGSCNGGASKITYTKADAKK